MLWNAGIAFPLQRLHDLIVNDIWSDERSRHLWEDAFPFPYQLWNSDPTTSEAEFNLQDVELVCPWCEHVTTINVSEFQLMHVTKKAKCKCLACNCEFDTDNLSAQHLKLDLKQFSSTEEGWCNLALLLLTR